jgi:hypothetical protein
MGKNEEISNFRFEISEKETCGGFNFFVAPSVIVIFAGWVARRVPAGTPALLSSSWRFVAAGVGYLGSGWRRRNRLGPCLFGLLRFS